MPTRIDKFGIEVNVRYASEPSSRERRIVEKRKLIRRAFDKIRRDQARQDEVTAFARALGGKAKITGALIESAKSIVGSRAQPEKR